MIKNSMGQWQAAAASIFASNMSKDTGTDPQATALKAQMVASLTGANQWKLWAIGGAVTLGFIWAITKK